MSSKMPPSTFEDNELTYEERVNAIRELTEELPYNDFGFPMLIYRTDLLPFHKYRKGKGKEHNVNGTNEDFGSSEQSVGILEHHVDDGDHPVAANHSSSTLPRDVSPIDCDIQHEGSPHDELDSSHDTSQPSAAQMDPFSLLEGKGDGLDDTIHVERPKPKKFHPSEYRVAGFPAIDLQAAVVPLQYDEGYPAFNDGRAFWARMDFEPANAYQAFERYLQMSFGRHRDPEDPDDYGIAANGSRAIHDLVLNIYPGINDTQLLARIAQVQEYYHLYYWGLRARAYDAFRVAQYRKQQELRAIETNDDHYLMARKLRARVLQYMESEEEFWDLMTPKVGIDLLRTTLQAERISAGLPANGPGTTKEEAPSQSFEMTLRTVAQGSKRITDEGGNTITEDGAILDAALEDPRTTEILQELVIKTGGG